MFRKKTFLVVIALVLVISGIPLSGNVHADSIITVKTDADNIISDTLCSLREAITNANDDAPTFSDCVSGSGNDTIIIDNTEGVYTIILDSALPAISDADGLSIWGLGATLSGSNLYRIFTVNSNASLSLEYVTIVNGYAENPGNGGGIQNNGGILTITNSIFSNNSSTGYGGAIYNGGSLTITKSTFSNNVAVGGSVWNANGTLTIANSTFYTNHGNGSGGAVSNDQGVATIVNSTFSGNTDTSGGAIWNNDTLYLNNTILANSGSGRDCYNAPGASATGTNNLISTTDANYTCGMINGVNGNLVGFSAGLSTLTGSPAYYPLERNSLAINAGNDAACASAPVNNDSQNQGSIRPIGGHCDIGSFEYVDPVDPSMAWNTFLGGAVDNTGMLGIAISEDITVDSSGNIYVAGTSSSTWGNPLRAFTPGLDQFGEATDDGYIAKIDPSGNIIWHTFLGGSDYDQINGVAVDGVGNVYVIGHSSATWGNPIRAYNADNSAFVAKLNSSGSFIWNTFLGGFSAGIAVDGSANIYIAGASSSAWGTPIHPYTSGYDMSVAKLDTSGSLVWNTFFGGSGNDYGDDVAVKNGHLYVEGQSNDSWGNPLRFFSSQFDAYLAKLDSSTGALSWNTFLGGYGDDYGRGIAVDGNENIYLAGTSNYVSWGNPVRPLTTVDSFAAKLDSSGALIWNTFLGGSGDDSGRDIAVDGNGEVFVMGNSFAPWGTPLTAYNGADPFVANLSSSGVLIQHIFLGEIRYDTGYGIAIADGYGYVAGLAEGTWGAPLRPFEGNMDGFIAKVLLTLPFVSSSVRADSNLTTAASVNFTVDFSESVTGVDVGDFSLTTSGVSGAAVSGVSGSGSVYTVAVNTGSGNGTIRLDVVDNNSIVDVASNPLGGVAVGDGNFTTGEVYAIIHDVNFTDQLFHTSNPPTVVTIPNTHGTDIHIGTLLGSASVGTTWNTGQSFFIENDTCSGATVIPSGSCTFKVRFLP
ncbi:MAG: SBBP repeat-containing protein, partial [Chloroflexi bacterium]|nr:SBBP repeat-containing protein [Chloroflexota bacterium]